MPTDHSTSPDRAAAGPRNFLRLGLAGEWTVLRRPTVLLAVFALIFVPSLYVLIYVSSVWDPYGALPRLATALVNEDRGTTVAGRAVKVGNQMVETLQRQRPFDFVPYDSAEKARAAVRAGTVFFAVIIPADFSERAAAPVDASPAALEIYVSEGGNFTASVLSKRFGAELAHTVNETLNRERWTLLVGDKDRTGDPTLREGLQALRTGGKDLAAGAAQLQAGSGQLYDGVGQARQGANRIAAGLDEFSPESARLSGGMRQVSEAVGTIRKKLPEDRQLAELAQGVTSLRQGALELRQGLAELEKGVPQLAAGLTQLQDGAAKVPFVGGRLAAGAGQIKDGFATFGEGLARAGAGGVRLSDGLGQLEPAVQTLTAGLLQLSAGLRELDEKLPRAEKLAQFDAAVVQLRDGARQLADRFGEIDGGAAQIKSGALTLKTGADTLAAGLEQAGVKFESGFGERRPAMLAAPVEAVIVTTAPVPNNGAAFAPYFSALSLWVGAVMMTFVFYVRRLPSSLQPATRPVKWLAKATPLLVLGCLQATVVVSVLIAVMSVPVVHPGLVWSVAVLGSLTFVSIVVLFMTVLGDAGRLLAVVLLILQLAASGGIYPIALSPSLYQTLHPYLPFTLLVRCFRATMFGAFDGQWTEPAAGLAAFGVGAVLLATLLARWKYVAPENYGPAVEF